MGKATFRDYKPGEPRICNWTSSVHFGKRLKDASSEPPKDPPAQPEVEPPSSRSD